MIQFMRRSPAVSEVVQGPVRGFRRATSPEGAAGGRAQRAVIEIMRSLVLRRRLAEEAE